MTPLEEYQSIVKAYERDRQALARAEGALDQLLKRHGCKDVKVMEKLDRQAERELAQVEREYAAKLTEFKTEFGERFDGNQDD